MSAFILYYKKDDKLFFFTKDEKEVDFLCTDAIMSYYIANKLHSSLSKTSCPELRMTNLIELILNNFSETLLEKLLQEC